MTPREYVEERLLSRPLTTHDLIVQVGSRTVTGSYSRLLRVAGSHLVLLDAERVRADWATGGFAIRLPGDLMADESERASQEPDIPAEVVALAPSGRLVDACPRGARPELDVVSGTLVNAGTAWSLDLEAGNAGAVVQLQWSEVHP